MGEVKINASIRLNMHIETLLFRFKEHGKCRYTILHLNPFKLILKFDLHTNILQI